MTESTVRAKAEDQTLPEAPPALPRVEERSRLVGWLVREPFVPLLAYYLVLVVGGALLIGYSPVMRHALVGLDLLGTTQEAGQLLTGGLGKRAGADALGAVGMEEIRERSLTTLLVILGALALVVPVVWVYMKTKRLRYDPSVVQSVIILPIVVTGILMIVKNSVALAFSLAGIVAAVRFRNTLKDPRDAVYIFLVIGIGLSAGVQALDVAVAMSLVFNLVVLGLWRFNVGSIYGGRYGRTGVLSTGDPTLLVAESPEQNRRIRRSMLGETGDIDADGILLVHAPQPELARAAAQDALAGLAKDWRLVRIVPRGERLATLEYLVRLRKKTTPAELIGELGERGALQVEAAEYVPFRVRARKRIPSRAEEDA